MNGEYRVSSVERRASGHEGRGSGVEGGSQRQPRSVFHGSPVIGHGLLSKRVTRHPSLVTGHRSPVTGHQSLA